MNVALKYFALCVAITFGLPSISSVHAQDAGYPSRPIHIIIPYAAGSPTDTYSRKISDVAQKHLGVPLVIENKPGATGVLGAAQIARSKPDGYSLLISSSEPFIASTITIKSVPYDSMKDFRFITKLFASTPVLVINASNNIKNLAELITQAKLKPITYGSFGPGSFHQLSIEEFAKQAGIKLQEIPYRSPVQVPLAVLSNEVALGYTAPAQAVDQIKEGRIRALAVIGPRRVPLLPDVPTFEEDGFDAPVLRTPLWIGVIGPAKLPEAVVTRIYEAFHRALQDQEIQQFFGRLNNQLLGNEPHDFDREIREEYAQVIPLLKSRNISSD
ncbi:MAG: Bug family tripartite tricarboxylate transporter substrate binding protein [Pseudomonadota bacterium]